MLSLAGFLLLLWTIGLLINKTFGGALHLLPVIALGIVIYGWWSQRRTAASQQ